MIKDTPIMIPGTISSTPCLIRRMSTELIIMSMIQGKPILKEENEQNKTIFQQKLSSGVHSKTVGLQK